MFNVVFCIACSVACYFGISFSRLITWVGEERERERERESCSSAVDYSYFYYFCSKEPLFLYVLGKGYVILLWHCLCFPYNYIEPGAFGVPNNQALALLSPVFSLLAFARKLPYTFGPYRYPVNVHCVRLKWYMYTWILIDGQVTIVLLHQIILLNHCTSKHCLTEN